jgi:AraC-like DNA-binding protein/mannose-6-phosphate isomerase-like protein (cupin superfamily)
MKGKDHYPKIITDETLRETARHGSEEYPFRYYVEDIWSFDFHCIDWHWHSEVEFVFVEKGTAVFLVGSGRYMLSAGMGIFINTQVIHRFEAAESTVIPNIVFSASLLSPEGSLIHRKYIQPVLNSSADCLVFSPDVPWQNEALNTLLPIFAIQEAENPSEIKTAELLFKLWNTIYENAGLTENIPVSQAAARAQVQIMMQYIHQNYCRHISLDDIAGTVKLSKSSVLNLFRRYLHTSPISYLVNHRLKCAAMLLVTTENSVSSVAQETGFENTGYFCRKFKELFRQTPGEYRKGSLCLYAQRGQKGIT